MSQLNVDTIKKADGTGNLSVPAETGTVVTTASPSLGRRNLIINGAMQVAQRGTSETGITSSGYYTVDRWQSSLASMGTFTNTQSTDAPDGFAYSCKWECTSAEASPVAGAISYASYRIEGQDVQQLGYGGASPKPVTISFWVKSNKTGTYQFNFRNLDANNMISGTYEINSSATWEYKTFTFSGSADAFDNDNNVSLFLEWGFGAGSNFTTGSVPTSWETRDNTDRQAGQAVNLSDTVGNYWQITGVQLEVGSVATPFEHRSYGEELALCQRYFERFKHEGDNEMITTISAYNSSAAYGAIYYSEKRTSPSISDGGTSSPFRIYGNNTAVSLDANDLYYQHMGNKIGRVGLDGSYVQGYSYFLQFNHSSAYIDIDAEL